MNFTFRGRKLSLRPSAHRHIWVMGGSAFMIAKFIQTEVDTLIQLLDGALRVVGYISTTTLAEVAIIGGVPLIGETVDAG